MVHVRADAESDPDMTTQEEFVPDEVKDPLLHVRVLGIQVEGEVTYE